MGRIELGDDADNVRVDAARNRVFVGYGKGALAVIDPVSQTKTADIRLKAHPEGFQIDKTGTQVFVNVPDARGIEVVDLAAGSTRALPTQGAGSNFPMAIDAEEHRVLVVFRSPPTLMALSSEDGHVAATVEACGDADDVFVDPKRRRVYVSCGEGVIDVLEPGEPGYRRLARVPTVSGRGPRFSYPNLTGSLSQCGRRRMSRQRFGCSVPPDEVEERRCAAASASPCLLVRHCTSLSPVRRHRCSRGRNG
jgi:hypothetical protein